MSGLTFLAPFAFAWLLLVPVLILLYFRRRARMRRAVSNLFLWRAALQHVEARPHVQRLRANIQLLLQIAFVVAVTLALASPTTSCAGGQRVVVIVDQSASMQARHGTATRLQDAIASAMEAVDELPAGAAVAVIAAGASPELVQEGTADRRRARRAIEGIAAEAAAADLDAALSLAWNLATPAPDELLLFTDISAAVPPSAQSSRVRIMRVGDPAANVAITRLGVRPHPGSGLDGQVFAEIANFGAEAARVPLAMSQRDRVLHREEVSLGPGARRGFIVNVEDASVPVTARIDSADALIADNEVTARIPGPARVRLLASDEPYVRAALAANPRVRLLDANTTEPADVVVCADCTPASRPESMLVLRGAAGSPAALTVADREHPAIAFARFEDVAAAVREVAPARGARVLLTAGRRPVVTASEQDGRRILDVGLNLRDAAMPVSVTFPIFMANAVEWLRGSALDSADVIPETESNLLAAPHPVDTRAPLTTEQREAARPFWRALLAIGLAVLAFLYARFRRDAHLPALRWAVLILLIASLAGYEIAAGAQHRHVVFAIDLSGSVPAAVRVWAIERIAAYRQRADAADEVSLVTFGGNALVEARRGHRVPDQFGTVPNPDATDISSALRFARSVAGSTGRVVLVSDGNETRGDARAEARRLGAEQVAIDVLPLGDNAAARPEVTIAAVTGPTSARAREPFDIDIDIQSTVRQPVHVQLIRDGVTRSTRSLQIDRGTHRVRLSDSAEVSGVLQYEVMVEAERDVIRDNNRAGAMVTVRGAARLLYVCTRSGAPGAAILRAQGFDVIEAAPTGLPTTNAALATFDGVVMDDVRADQVSAAQQQALGEYVERRGGGLFVTGGGASFGPGGWATSRLEDLLPIDMRPPARRDASDAGLVLVLDKSGSMAELEQGSRKIDIAVRAAVPLVDLFAASRTLGVIAFDTAPVAVVPLGEAAEPRRMLERMRTLTAGGGTMIAPAVELARDWLRRSRARRRHVVLLSDGRSSAADLAALKALAATRETTISTIAVGEGVDRSFLEGIAASSGGRAYFPETLARLPEIFLQEATLAASNWEVRERFTPAVESDHPILRGVDASGLGAVSGYIASTPRPAASVVLATPRRDPLLAVWQRGLGRTGVLTTSLHTGWSDALRASPAFAQAWSQSLRWVARPRDTGRLHPDVGVRDESVTIALDAFTPEGGFLNFLDVRATIEPGAADAREIALREAAPGRYEAAPLTLPAGFHRVRITAGDDSVITGVNVPAAAEYAADGPDHALLADVARLTGGRVLGTADSPFDAATPDGRTIDTRQVLAGLALLLFLVDVAVGRGLLAGVHLLAKRRAVHAE